MIIGLEEFSKYFPLILEELQKYLQIKSSYLFFSNIWYIKTYIVYFLCQCWMAFYPCLLQWFIAP